MKGDDDQFGFQKSLDGNEENWVKGRVYKGKKPWLSKYQGKDFSKKKTKIDIDVISFFTAVVIVMSLLFFCPLSHAVEIKTNTKPLFVYSLNSCIEDLNKDIPTENQIPSELIVAQAVIETGWGVSRFANEANNLFGIREGLKVFKTKCDSVADYIRIINEVPAYAEFREMRQDGVTDALLLARTLKRWAADPNYTDLIEDVIQHNIRGVYEL
jgi:Bax protein